MVVKGTGGFARLTLVTVTMCAMSTRQVRSTTTMRTTLTVLPRIVCIASLK